MLRLFPTIGLWPSLKTGTAPNGFVDTTSLKNEGCAPVLFGK